MELAHSLLLNEECLAQLRDVEKPVFIYEWLRFLDKVLVAAQKSDIKEKQNTLVEQLLAQLHNEPGPPTRRLLASCLANVFHVGDSLGLFDAIDRCNDIMRSKDDSLSYLQTKLAAICCLGGMYERLGRLVGRTFKDTVTLLVKAVKTSESQVRAEIMHTLERVVNGLGAAGSGCYKEIYKAAKTCLTAERHMHVRCAAARCMMALVQHAAFMYTTELESVVSLCLKALAESNYDVRCDVARLLGFLLHRALSPATQHPGQSQSMPGSGQAGQQSQSSQQSGSGRKTTMEEALNLLAGGFLKGGGSFLKSGVESLKNSGPNREIRVGVSYAYVQFASFMGSRWLERNLQVYLSQVLQLLSNPKTTSGSHVDCVYARNCVLYILHTISRTLLSDRAQLTAAREIIAIVASCSSAAAAAATAAAVAAAATAGPNSASASSGGIGGGTIVAATTSSSSGSGDESAQLIVCAMQHLAGVLYSAGSSAAQAARLASAHLLKCLALALPGQLSPLLDRCLTQLQQLKTSPESVHGCSLAIAGLVSAVSGGHGVPQAKARQVFQAGEELLRLASQNSRLSLQRTQAAWFLLGAGMTLSGPAVRPHLPRMFLTWRNALPRSAKELEAERSRGDAFTWQVTLESRAGALCSMQAFLTHCPELCSEETLRRLLQPLDQAVTMMASLPQIVKSFGPHLKAPAALCRQRLYCLLQQLPTSYLESMHHPLLRELVSEFTLTENPANHTTSLLRSLCHPDDSAVLGSWLQDTDDKILEDQLQPYLASGSGALEHDPAALFLTREPASMTSPGPLPLGVSVIDNSLQLFGVVFPRVNHKHRQQMLNHFGECIRQARSSRQQAIQVNIFTAVLSAMKKLAESRSPFGDAELRTLAVSLILDSLSSQNPVLRCAGAECLGRMCQVIDEGRFTSEMAAACFERLQTSRDACLRTGHALALGCLHRYVGSIGSVQSILETSVKNYASINSVTHVWSLHALALIADSGAPQFRSFVSLNLVTTARMSCLVCCAIMQQHPDALVQATAVSCLQQLHMFAPRHVNLAGLVPLLCKSLDSPHLVLRRAAVSCLRQLAQRESDEVVEHAERATAQLDPTAATSQQQQQQQHLTQRGLEAALFAMLDRETDAQLRGHLRDTLHSLLNTARLGGWLQLLKEVLQSATVGDTGFSGEDDSALGGGAGGKIKGGGPLPLPAVPKAPANPTKNNGGGDDDDDEDDDDDDDDGKFRGTSDAEVTHPVLASRWPTRVLAVELLLRLMTAGVENQPDKPDKLVPYLADLVKMAFIAATAESDQLRLCGLDALERVIRDFASVPEPELPGVLLLEQYQAQVGAALRPAFAPDTSPDVTAAACRVCSAWIGSGVARDLGDLRRVTQLLVSSLAKLSDSTPSASKQVFSESAATMERLAVLRAWAQVYIIGASSGGGGGGETSGSNEDHGGSLLSFVRPQLHRLADLWLAALREHALLSLPAELASQLPAYKPDIAESSRPHYAANWAALLEASALRLREEESQEPTTGFNNTSQTNAGETTAGDEADRTTRYKERLHLLLGLAVEALCALVSRQPLLVVDQCLRACAHLLEPEAARLCLSKEPALLAELAQALHRTLLTRDSPATHNLCCRVLARILSIGVGLKEGRDSGAIIPGHSVAFACLEAALCLLLRYQPDLCPQLRVPACPAAQQQQQSESPESQLLASAVALFPLVPPVCSPAGALSVLPALCHLLLAILQRPPPQGQLAPVRRAARDALLALARDCESRGAIWTELCACTALKVSQTDHLDTGERAKFLSDLCLTCPAMCRRPQLADCLCNLLDALWTSNTSAELSASLVRAAPLRRAYFARRLAPKAFAELLRLGELESADDANLNALDGAAALASAVLSATNATDQVVSNESVTRRKLLLLLLTPLVNLLQPERPDSAASRQAWIQLQKVLPQYAELTRSLLIEVPELKTRLEATQRALQAKQQQQRQQGDASQRRLLEQQQQQPTIQLKMDFSGFS
uniref:HEAT repeat-containing protein 5B n=1 Tax=Macrostomum lignano TaxID=282301 RepID=A0A1I8JIY2_9PLAT